MVGYYVFGIVIKYIIDKEHTWVVQCERWREVATDVSYKCLLVFYTI